jgi:hypothetical protein
MSIHLSAYDTTVLAHVSSNMTKLIGELKKAYAMGGLHLLEYTPNQLASKMTIALVEGGNMHADEVGFFKHPLFFKEGNETIVAVDVRHFGSIDRSTYEFRVSSPAEYAWEIRRACMNLLWDQCRYEIFRDISKIPIRAYASVFGQCLSKRFGLNPAEQAKATVLAAFFYLCQFSNLPFDNEESKLRAYFVIQSTTKIPEAIISETLAGIEHIENLTELAKHIRERLDTHALRDFNLGVLLQITSLIGYGGHRSAEIVAAGLEHPPTWILLVESAINSKTFKRSVLAKMVENMKSRDQDVQLKKAVEMLIGPKSALTHKTINGTVEFDDRRDSLL